MEVYWHLTILISASLLLRLPSYSTSSIPHIFTKGTHFEIAHDIGSTFKFRIQQFYKQHPLLYSTFIPWSQTQEGKQVLHDYYTVLEHDYPQYLEELQGMAKGAGVPFIQAFMITYQMEIATILRTTIDEPSECSDVYNNIVDSVAIAHNEDTFPIIKNLSYFVTVDIKDTKVYPNSKIQTQHEKFTSFCYPGVLPGNTFAFNRHGIVQTVNALFPTQLGLNKTGRYILTRAILTAKSIKEALAILQNHNTGAATGFSVNMGILPTKENNLADPQLWNIEVAPTIYSNSSVNVFQLYSNYSSGNYFHVNKYRRINIAENVQKIKSSIERTARIEELLPVKSNKDLLDILGDTKNSNFPIYRTPRPTDKTSTVATAMFDLLRRTVDVYGTNPKTTGPLVTFSLDLTDN